MISLGITAWFAPRKDYLNVVEERISVRLWNHIGSRSSACVEYMTSQPTKRSLYKRVLPPNLVELSSDEGKKRFQSAQLNGDADAFFTLLSSFQMQSDPAFCGLTTLATVLNALQVDPERVWKHPWRWYSEILLECCISLEHVRKHGTTVDQLAMISRCEGCTTDVLRGLDVEAARRLVQRGVRDQAPAQRELVVAAYDRAALSQTGSGHFSPIAAYDQQTDSVLILDVAQFKVSSSSCPQFLFGLRLN